MGSEEVGPTEETLDALMEYLVGPLLPLKHTDIAKETQSESKLKTVAKQVHAAAVLYNFFHLSHHRESQFLKFEQFCKLAILFKPSILQHMKYMCQSDHTILNDPENQLSLAEKAIMDACTISETLLNASANISNVVKEWKITKVSVLLIDSKKENCFLQFNNGVWSVIEKELYPESKKRKKIGMEYDEEDEVGFQKLAFLAVKEVAGIMYGKLKVLESHLVYSLSQAKTATRFYIVQSTQAMSEDNLIPIQDVISSLQGPVVKKCLGSWVITPVVEYYHLLPFAEIISKMFSRESNNLPHQIKNGSADLNIIQGSQRLCEKERGDRKKASDNLQKKSKLDSEIVNISNSSKEQLDDCRYDKITYKFNQCSKKESDESKKVSGNLQNKSKLDSEILHISNSSKEEPHDSKFSKKTYKSNQCSENESCESMKFSDNLQKKSKFDSEIVHISNLSKEEPHDSKVNKNTNNSNQCSSILKPVSKVKDDAITSKIIEIPVDQNVNETQNSTGKSIMVSNSDGMKQEDMDGSCRAMLNKSSTGANNNLGMDKLFISPQTENQSTKFQKPLKFYCYKRRSKLSSSINNKTNLKDLQKTSLISQHKDERVDGECMVPSKENRSPTENHVLEDFNSIVDAKKSELTNAALRALLNKRQKLYDQQRVTEGELTLCDKKIQAIMLGGLGDCLGLKLEAVIECCNEICKQDGMQTQDTNLHVSRSLILSSGKSLSEAQLSMRKACQELDDICLSNNWMLPTYCTSRSDAGFVANVTVKGTNFVCSGVSGDQPSIHEARNSAATHVITRLQQMANGMNTATLV
ncbi:hypothetical protein R6Q57_025100 [Mikania cordata]